MKCKICESRSPKFSHARILSRYDIDYFQCSQCGFVQTEEPYWLEEAYSEAIAFSDVGLVFRNNIFATITSNILFNCFDHEQQFLDYGGGYGLFVRLMRDLGYDFFWYDRYCQNLFAKGFAADLSENAQYELITAFEVLEHLVNPVETIQQLLTFSPNILISTTLLPPDAPKPGEWGYYALHEGQHVGIFTLPALQIIADRCERKLYSNGSTVHLFTQQEIPQAIFDQLTQAQRADQRKASLLEADYYKMINVLVAQQETNQPTQPLCLLAIPDWSQPEDILSAELARVIGELAGQSDRPIWLHIYLDTAAPLTLPEAEMLLAAIMLELSLTADLALSDNLNVALQTTLDETFCQQVDYRVAMTPENEAAIAAITPWQIPRLS